MIDTPLADGTGVAAAEAIDRIRALYRGSLREEAVEWEHDGGVPASVYRRLGEIGAFQARWPEGARRPGRVDVAATIIRETSQASVGAGIAVGTHMEGYFRALALSEYGQSIWGDALAGRAIGALSITERTGGSNPTHCETFAERTPSGWALSGHKHYVSNMRAATDVVVFARTDRGRDLSSFTLFVVPADAPGMTITPHHLVGAAASATSMLDLDGVEVADEHRVGAVGSGLIILLDLLRAERVGAACGGLAVAELCFEIALAYTDRRLVGGTPLRQHQAVAHRLATLASDIAAGRALLSERLAAAQRGRISSAEAGQAKLVLNRVAWRAADEAMQLLGGRGFSEETPLAQIWRDIRIGRIGGGADEVQLELIAQSLRPGELARHPAVVAVAREAEA
ncbi:MAG TPA: acyl-CoA dehydrogenase family protein [Solirubrobacteraceae bacterium]|jgi:alkylation response protein AidB-like acyl-CoA dehydrogenase|nr:acyl-CoA dehydrogenase family protein [Solirubrobacteraceae bacterium]